MARVKSKRYLQRFPLCVLPLCVLVVVILSVFYRFLWFVPYFFLYLFSFTINCKIFPRGFYSELFSVHSAHRFIVRFLISHFIIHYSLVVCVWWGKFIEPQKSATNYETQNSVNCQMFDGSGYLWLTDRERERNIHTYVHKPMYTQIHTNVHR